MLENATFLGAVESDNKVSSHGPRGAVAVFGAIDDSVGAFCVGALAWRFVRDRLDDLGLALEGDAVTAGPRRLEAGFTVREAKATCAFWVLALAAALPPMIGTALLFDIKPLFLARGLDPGDAALAVSAWSATMAITALPSGRLVDRVAARWLVVSEIVLALGCAMWLFVGTVIAAAAAVIVGPLAFDISHRLSGGYEGALLTFIALCLPAAAASLWLTPPAAPEAKRAEWNATPKPRTASAEP